MTTQTPEIPRFETTTHHAGLRAMVILGLCATLLASFVAQSVHAPAPAHATDTMACTTAGPAQKAC